MSSEFGHVQTVLGKVHADELGITLPHEHLFNDLSSVLAEPTYEFSTKIVRQEVTPSWQWALKQDPYCCADNVAAKPVDDIVREAEIFQALGGKTIVDATGSAKIGRNPARLKEAAERTGLHVIMATGTYLEKFERADIAGPSVEEIRDRFLEELTNGVEGVFPGLIGEIGVSPAFTEGERAALKGAALAQAGFGALRSIFICLVGNVAATRFSTLFSMNAVLIPVKCRSRIRTPQVRIWITRCDYLSEAYGLSST